MQQIQGILCGRDAAELASRGKNRATIQDVVVTLCTDAARPRCHNRISFDDVPTKHVAGWSKPCIFKLLPRLRGFSVKGLSTNSSKMRAGDTCLNFFTSRALSSKNLRPRPHCVRQEPSWRKTWHWSSRQLCLLLASEESFRYSNVGTDITAAPVARMGGGLMTATVQTGRCASIPVEHRDCSSGSGGGYDHVARKAKDYRPSSVIATGSFGAVSPPLSG